jgi:cysteine desulfurase
MKKAVTAAELRVARDLAVAEGEVGVAARGEARQADGEGDASQQPGVARSNVPQRGVVPVGKDEGETQAARSQDDGAAPRGAAQDGDARFAASRPVDVLLRAPRAAQDDERPRALPQAEALPGAGVGPGVAGGLERAEEPLVEGQVLLRRGESEVEDAHEGSAEATTRALPVYLDCAATTPLDPHVRATLRRHLDEEFGNAGSRTHEYGRRARRAVERARDQVAAVVGAGRGEVIFTSGATESDNLALLGLAEHGLATGRTHVVSTQIEHHAVLGPLQALERRGFRVTRVPPRPDGWVEPAAVREALTDETLFVSVMHVNNETGVVQPVDEIADALGGHPAFFHVDAAQGFAKELRRLRHPRIDLISVSGHKIHAPKGVGALILRRRAGERPPLSPLFHGGGQELGLRPGTLPVALIAALGEAAERAASEAQARALRCRELRERLLEALAPLAPAVNGDPERTLPHILNLSFPGRDADAVIEAWQDLAALSDGAACTTQSRTCSHVLSAMGLPADRREGALRLSWCHLTPVPPLAAMVAALTAVR